MSEQKPRKFKAKEQIEYEKGHWANVSSGEVLTLKSFHYDDTWISFEEKHDNKDHRFHWQYCSLDFEEVFEDENPEPLKIIDPLFTQSLLTAKVPIDDLIKLKSVFSYDEIVEMIERGIV